MRFRLIGIVVLLGVAILVGASSVFVVHETNQAIILQFGNYKRTEQEAGIKLKVPFVQDVIYMDRRILALDLTKAEVIASDEKRLEVDALVRFRISDPLQFYKAVQGNETVFRDRLTASAISNLTEVLGRAPFNKLLTDQRATLMAEIRDRVTREASGFGVQIVDVRIKRADLPVTVSQQVFERMRKEYNEQAASIRAEGREKSDRIRADADRERRVTLAEANRQADITRGEGDGEAVRTFAEAFGRDVEFFEFYRAMQAYRKTVGSQDTLVLSPDSEFFKFFGSMKANAR